MTAEPVGVGMIGCGTVGGGVATLLREQTRLYAQRVGRPIELRKVLVRDPAKTCEREGIPKRLVTADADEFFGEADMPIVVEVAGGRDVMSRYVRRALRAGKHVVTANKSLLAAEGVELFALARQHNACIAFEASCGGGIPCVTALQFGLMANQVRGIYGILNGTCNYILTEMTRHGKTYATALAEAQQLGYAEADPTFDVSGKDAAQKLAIFASLAFGVQVPESAVRHEGIDKLQLEDIKFGAELGYDVKLLTIAEREEGQQRISVSVQPCFVHERELLAQVVGSFNALSIHGHAVGHSLLYGRGAGRMPPTNPVVSDLLNVASGWYPAAFAHMRLTPDVNGPAQIVDPKELVSRFYLRIMALDVPGVMAKITRILGEKRISLSAVLQHEAKAGQFVPVVVTTHAARQGDIYDAVAALERLDELQGEPVVIRIVDFPS